MKSPQLNLASILAIATLTLSISGWAIKTTVSNMILENSNNDLKVNVSRLKEDLRWCRIYGGGIVSPMLTEPEVLIPSYLLSKEPSDNE